MEFKIEATGELIDNGEGMTLNCSTTIEGDVGGMIGGISCLIKDIANEINTTVEEVITEIYTNLKQIEN